MSLNKIIKKVLKMKKKGTLPEIGTVINTPFGDFRVIKHKLLSK